MLVDVKQAKVHAIGRILRRTRKRVRKVVPSFTDLSLQIFYLTP